MGSAAPPEFHTSGIVRLTRPQLVGTMTGLVLAMLLAALDQTIVGTAEPRIIASLSGFNRYPWVATAYMLSSTITVPIIAKLSDLFGRKWAFLWGSIAFVAASVLCGAAGNIKILPLDGMNQLILFRGLQGIGAGCIMALIFTIVGDIFSPAERGRYQGFSPACGDFRRFSGPRSAAGSRTKFPGAPRFTSICRWASSPSQLFIRNFQTSARRPSSANWIGWEFSRSPPASSRCSSRSPG
jgi:MFS family permease